MASLQVMKDVQMCGSIQSQVKMSNSELISWTLCNPCLAVPTWLRVWTMAVEEKYSTSREGVNFPAPHCWVIQKVKSLTKCAFLLCTVYLPINYTETNGFYILSVYCHPSSSNDWAFHSPDVAYYIQYIGNDRATITTQSCWRPGLSSVPAQLYLH